MDTLTFSYSITYHDKSFPVIRNNKFDYAHLYNVGVWTKHTQKLGNLVNIIRSVNPSEHSSVH